MNEEPLKLIPEEWREKAIKDLGLGADPANPLAVGVKVDGTINHSAVSSSRA
jgi:hypothetical protein